MTATYLAFLAAFPDTHVVRRHGPASGARGAPAGPRVATARTPRRARRTALHAELRGLDRELKARGINPGTSADLTVASHFAASLVGAACVGRSN